ncbi:MAG: class I SAM-dependent methyltransferase [Myxococcales bacterium]|nr:class I SAM-dependent methyltransferase [Myxococcales bacterium]HIK83684.1 class I SAM-dependent methyltransferase [Myxococcales bacterium]
MQIQGPDDQENATEFEVLSRLLPLPGARLLELGCGAAEKTRQIAENAKIDEIVAVEIDLIQHAKNLKITDLPSVTFKSFGAEAIDEPDDSFDIVLMFKSLHHVPKAEMDTALSEIHRVLKPGGLAYISEPVFAGSFNEVIRLFHDESTVRLAAFEAVARAVGEKTLELADEIFFTSAFKLKHFGQFEAGVLNVTHTDHQLTPEILQAVKNKFESYRSDEGYLFETPNRVDLLRKPVGVSV